MHQQTHNTRGNPDHKRDLTPCGEPSTYTKSAAPPHHHDHPQWPPSPDSSSLVAHPGFGDPGGNGAHQRGTEGQNTKQLHRQPSPNHALPRYTLAWRLVSTCRLSLTHFLTCASHSHSQSSLVFVDIFFLQSQYLDSHTMISFFSVKSHPLHSAPPPGQAARRTFHSVPSPIVSSRRRRLPRLSQKMLSKRHNGCSWALNLECHSIFLTPHHDLSQRSTPSISECPETLKDRSLMHSGIYMDIPLINRLICTLCKQSRNSAASVSTLASHERSPVLAALCYQNPDSFPLTSHSLFASMADRHSYHASRRHKFGHRGILFWVLKRLFVATKKGQLVPITFANRAEVVNETHSGNVRSEATLKVFTLTP
ncbi:uncharacterized protein CLUP02_14415 [Colletotrichum lupini]|uniref:Uncharacterized protein n=1 Tax=Colletotrichum lupini TaxID=145971 RepID=A0A9Q8T481_9PEZI|nr:uncharacterized protein CLUP02_14415 [Colletotrichum lupini]UQC88888.1 hypothetical protein CLUP02_14415 [Colletotrichum lupini]